VEALSGIFARVGVVFFGRFFATTFFVFISAQLRISFAGRAAELLLRLTKRMY